MEAPYVCSYDGWIRVEEAEGEGREGEEGGEEVALIYQIPAAFSIYRQSYIILGGDALYLSISSDWVKYLVNLILLRIGSRYCYWIVYPMCIE